MCKEVTRVLEVFNLLYTYPSVKNKIKILENIDFTLLEGEMVALLGPSGSGKTTFLNCVGLIDKPNSGIIKILDDNNLNKFEDFIKVLNKNYNNIILISQIDRIKKFINNQIYINHNGSFSSLLDTP